MTRSAQKLEVLRELGAEAVVCDVFDRDGLIQAVSAFEPELVMHGLTDLPDDVGRIPEFAARNNRIRTEGTDSGGVVVRYGTFYGPGSKRDT